MQFLAIWRPGTTGPMEPRLDHVQGGVAHDLQTVIGTDDDGMVLYLTAGTRHQVLLDEDEDGRIVLTPAIQKLIQDHPASVAATS